MIAGLSRYTLAAATMLSCLAQAASAADATFNTENSFVIAAGSTVIESFETTASSARSGAAVAATLFTVAPLLPSTALIGVNSAPDSPNPGYGAFATDGTRYFTVYAPGTSQGSLVFNLAAPTTVFGFNIIDYGEAAGGVLNIATNAGGYSTGVQLASYAFPTLGNGNAQFFGITQTAAFTQVVLFASGIDDAYGLDKIYLSASPVSESGTAAMTLAGLASLAGLRIARRRHWR